MKNNVLAITLSGIVSLSSCNLAIDKVKSYPSQEIRVEFNSSEIEFDQTPILKENRVFVPFRQIFESMGTVVFYSETENKIIGITRDGDFIEHIIGNNYVQINGEKKEFDVSSFVENGRTLVPVRFIAELLCAEVEYQEDLKKVQIEKVIHYNEYHKGIKEVLNYSIENLFNPLNFKRYCDYKNRFPNKSMAEIVLNVNMNLDYPFYTNIKEIENPHDLLTLCNKYNKLPTDFYPYNVVSLDAGYYNGNGRYVNAVLKDDFQQMVRDGKANGVNLISVSALRTESHQDSLYKSSISRNGKVNADKYSARPGHSEHQLGLAIDVNSTSITFENIKEFKWLQTNANKYGFILRYEKGKEHIHGYTYEPWHYRYVGKEVAKIIHDEGITFEEFHVKYINQQDFVINKETTKEKVLSKY